MPKDRKILLGEEHVLYQSTYLPTRIAAGKREANTLVFEQSVGIAIQFS